MALRVSWGVPELVKPRPIYHENVFFYEWIPFKLGRVGENAIIFTLPFTVMSHWPEASRPSPFRIHGGTISIHKEEEGKHSCVLYLRQMVWNICAVQYICSVAPYLLLIKAGIKKTFPQLYPVHNPYPAFKRLHSKVDERLYLLEESFRQHWSL